MTIAFILLGEEVIDFMNAPAEAKKHKTIKTPKTKPKTVKKSM